MLACTLLKIKRAMQLLHEQVFARSGPRQANALLARIAPGPPVTRQKIEVGIKPGGLKMTKAKKARAMLAQKAARKAKVKEKLERLLLKASEAAHLPRTRIKAEVLHLHLATGPLLLLENEVSLHLANLTGLLALDTLRATALILTASTGTLLLAGISRQVIALREANVNSCMLLTR